MASSQRTGRPAYPFTRLLLAAASLESDVARLPKKGTGITTGKFREGGRGNPQCGVRLQMHDRLGSLQPLTRLHVERVNEKGGNSRRRQRLPSRFSRDADVAHRPADGKRDLVGDLPMVSASGPDMA